MNVMDKSMRNESGLTRRQMLAGSAGLTFAFAFAPAMDALAQGAAGKLNAYVTIAADGAITILMPAPEMGQGVNTALPLIIAEELDADWSKVKVDQAPVNPAYNHPVFRAQYQVASLTTRGYWMPLRTAGAQARRVLLDGAAAVPVYTSGLEPPDLCEVALQKWNQGYRAFKLKIGFDARDDAAHLRALREGRVLTLGYDDLTPGPRNISAVEKLAEFLHGKP